MGKRIYIDMDDTIADFKNAYVFGGKPIDNTTVYPMYEYGFFKDLLPMYGSLSGVRALIRLGYDVHILTQPLAESAHSYAEKAQWIGLHFPDLINKVHMTQDKGLFLGDYLIDDNAYKWKAKFEANGGKFIEIGGAEFPSWKEIVSYFEKEAGK